MGKAYALQIHSPVKGKDKKFDPERIRAPPDRRRGSLYGGPERVRLTLFRSP
jgi:hypothetical protein